MTCWRIADGIPAAMALSAPRSTHPVLPDKVASHAMWSVKRLGPERIEYLRALPMLIEFGPFPFGKLG
jgi:hypothetical protein